MSYYKSYQTKEAAQEVASDLRKPGNAPRGYRYPISATVQPILNPRHQWLWAIYLYQR